ncbi:MAG: hypothetical protein IJZ07_08385 [Clostridia bacterium]|nr:hypothetical protein [Clostridia bacterium]
MAEKKIIDLKKKRNAITAKKIFKWLRIPLVILVVAAALFLSARLMGNVAVSNITDSIRQVKTIFTKSEGYPYLLETLNYRNVVPVGGGPLVIYDDSTLVLNAAADEIFNMQLGYADSKAVTRNGRALVYSPSSNEVIIQSKTEKLGSITEKNPVTAAALADNGGFATSHAADENQSVLSVYNNRFKKIFQWNCSQEFITDISLSGNGKRVAVAATGVEDAEIYTRILIFDIDSSEPKADIRYNGTMFLRVIYTSSGRVIAVGDNKTVVHNKKGEVLDELVYSEDSLVAVCADDSGNTTVCYEEFGGSKTGIARYSSGGKKTCSIVIDGLPDCVAAHAGRIAVASGNKITVYSSNGKESKVIETENPVAKVFICSGTVYTVEGGSIHKY